MTNTDQTDATEVVVEAFDRAKIPVADLKHPLIF